MDDIGDFDARLQALELLVTRQADTIERNRCEIAAVRTLLATVIDSIRPDDPSDASEWLDTIHEVATANVDLYTEVVQATMIREMGADQEMYETLERERDFVMKMPTDMIGALKRTSGEIG